MDLIITMTMGTAMATVMATMVMATTVTAMVTKDMDTAICLAMARIRATAMSSHTAYPTLMTLAIMDTAATVGMVTARVSAMEELDPLAIPSPTAAASPTEARTMATGDVVGMEASASIAAMEAIHSAALDSMHLNLAVSSLVAPALVIAYLEASSSAVLNSAYPPSAPTAVAIEATPDTEFFNLYNTSR